MTRYELILTHKFTVRPKTEAELVRYGNAAQPFALVDDGDDVHTWLERDDAECVAHHLEGYLSDASFGGEVEVIPAGGGVPVEVG